MSACLLPTVLWLCLQKIWRYDYAGIVVLIVTSFVPVVYYSFLCNPLIRNFYLLTTVGLGASCCPASTPPCFLGLSADTRSAQCH